MTRDSMKKSISKLKEKKKKKKKKKTIVSFLLDESGSMSSVKEITIDGVNSYIKDLKETRSDVIFSLVKFNSSGVNKVYASKPIEEVEEISYDSYNPRGITPLIDASYKMILATEGAVLDHRDPVDVIVIIQTDGEENSSVQYKTEDLKRLISEKKDLGWQFVFIGAGIDAYSTASSIGIGSESTMSYGNDQVLTSNAFRSLSISTSAYLSGISSSTKFSDDQRVSSGDQYFRKV